MNKIILQNQFDAPFGKLSNHYYHPMVISDRKYNTVTNYVLSNLLTLPIHKDIIQTKDIKGSPLSDKMIKILDIILKLNSSNLSIKDKHALVKELIKLPIYNMNIVPVFLRNKFAPLENSIKILQTGEESDQKFDEISKMLYLIDDELSMIKKIKNDLEIANETSLKDIYKTFYELQDKEYEMSVKTAVETAYNTLFNPSEYQSQDDIFKSRQIVDRLMSTKNLHIYYVDDDDILGTGKMEDITPESLKNSTGQNYIGKLLMSIRYKLQTQISLKQKSEEDEARKQRIYDNYLAYTILKKIMLEKSVKALEEYKNLTVEEVLKKSKHIVLLGKDESLDKYIVNMLYDKKTLERGLMDNIGRSSNYFIASLVNSNKDIIQKQVGDKKLAVVLVMYMKYIFSKKYGVSLLDDNMDNYVSTEMAKLSTEQLNDLKKRIYDLYKIGMLSESLSERIDAELEKLEDEAEQLGQEDSKEDSKEDSNSSDNGDIKELRNDKPKEEKLREEIPKEEKLNEEGVLILHNKTSPEYFRVFLPNEPILLMTIDGRQYPTIYHYMYTILLSYTGTSRRVDNRTNEVERKYGIGLNDAYKLILKPNTIGKYITDFKDIVDIKRDYDKTREESIKFFLVYYNKIGTNKKFENQALLETLILTDKMPIYWLEPGSVLGVDKDLRGENAMGKYLMELRTTLLSKYFTNYKTISTQFETIILEDSFLKNWIESRLQDICDMTYRFQTYINKKHGFLQVIDKDFVKFILKEFYSDCSYIMRETKTEPPRLFINRVNNCIGMPSFLYKQQSKELKDKKDSIDKQIRLITQEYQESSKRTTTQIKAFEEKQKKEYEDFLSNKKGLTLADFKAKQEQDYKNFLEYKTISRTIEEMKEFRDRQKSEYDDFKKQINKDVNIVKKEKTKSMKEFKSKQAKEYNAFYGIDIYKSKDKEAVFQHKIKSLKENFNSYVSTMNKNIEKLRDKSSKVADVYWRHIFSMLIFILTGVGGKLTEVSQLELKQIIINSQLLLSGMYDCNKILDDNEDNCILSAILNILRKMHNFKDTYTPQKALDADDVNMCKSIILNTSTEISIVSVEVDDTFVDYSDDKYSDDVKVIFRGDDDDEEVEEYDENDIDDGDDKEVDYGDGDYQDNMYFSFDSKEKSAITDELIRINPYLDKNTASELIKHIIRVMNDIKKYKKMPSNIKQNRINFFATLN